MGAHDAEALSASGAPVTAKYVYRAQVVRVIDADTLHLRIELGFHAALTVPCRLRGVDAPELDTVEGKEARAFLVDRFFGDPNLIIESYRDRQSFARWIVDAWLPDGRSLADVLVEAGHAIRVS